MWAETLDYRPYLPPYLPAFFDAVAARIPLRGSEALLDLGCGPGDLALGLARHVGELTGIDLELPMLDAAQRRAAEANRPMRLVHAKVEEAPDDLGGFDLITIGRACWFMHAPATLTRIDRWLRPGGVVLIGAPIAFDAEGPAWNRAFKAILMKWGVGDWTAMTQLTPQGFFAGSGFVQVDQIDVFAEQSLTLDDLVNRGFSFPATAPSVLGANAPRLHDDISRIMPRFLKNGRLVEKLHTTSAVFRRCDQGP